MLTVIAPASSTELTTRERAMQMLGLPFDDLSSIDDAIPLASQQVVDFCRRPFAAETVREVFRSPSNAGVLLGRGPVTNVVSVTEGDTALTADDYEVDPQTGLLHRLAGLYRVCWAYGPLAAVYTAGFTLPSDSGAGTLPPAVERAAILIVGAIVSARERDPMMRSEEIPGVRTVSWWVRESGELPSAEAETLLGPYRRIVG